MSRFDFKGTGEFARVNNTEAAMQLFEDYDIPYHYITKGENEGKIRVKSMKNFAHDEYEQLRSTLMSHGYGWLIDHAAMFHDVDDGVVICFSPYHFPYSIDDNGKITYREIVLYFDCHESNDGREIDEFFFRSKASGKWPGKVLIRYKDGSECVLSSSERKNLKEYFVPERCLYCLDKLNRNADIAVGDNYIKENADDEGVSSVIIRTEQGVSVWDRCRELFEEKADEKEPLLSSQLIESKRDNLAYGTIKGIYSLGFTKEQKKKYDEIMRKRKIGMAQDTYRSVSKDIKKVQFATKIKRKLKKLFRIK